MTVQELIDALNQRPDKSEKVLVAVMTHTQAYPLAYITPWQVSSSPWHEVRLFIHLPEGMYIGQKKR